MRGEKVLCPSCGAPLAWDGLAPTISCPYCKTAVVAPAELRATAAPPAPPVLLRGFQSLAEQEARLQEIVRLARANRKIDAIKLLRESFDLGLREAKNAVDMLAQGDSVQIAGINLGAR